MIRSTSIIARTLSITSPLIKTLVIFTLFLALCPLLTKQHLLFIEDKLFTHFSIAWVSANITYGLYLSDHSILDAIDTEMVVLSGIMIQNLKRETGWHLRGTRRIGVSFDDVEVVQQCVRGLSSLRFVVSVMVAVS